MVAVKQELVDLSDQVWQRLRTRLDGLTDNEYLWEPVPGCWTIRERTDGHWTADSTLPRPQPEPFTTIAWRLWHLIDMYGEDRAPRFLGLEPQGAPIGLDDPDGQPPSTADGAVELLSAAHDRWDAHVTLVSEAALSEAVGPVGGAYADRTRVAYVLHMLDEFIHHSAEVALLRDLWRWQHPIDADAVVERAMRGDLGIVDGVMNEPEADTELLRTAASYARWEFVVALLEAGVPPPTEGRTPLHIAAGAGELDVVKLLVERGADLRAKDPEFHATPLEWARFLDQGAVAEWLHSYAQGPETT